MAAPNRMNRALSWLYAVAGFALFLGAVGFLVPADRTVTREAVYQRDAQSLWQAVSEFPIQSRWRRGVDRTLALPNRNGHPAWRETGKDGTNTFELTVFDPPRRLVLETGDGDGVYRGTRTIVITDEERIRRVTVNEVGSVRNVYWRVLHRLVADRSDVLDAYLVDLGAKFGEATVPGGLESNRGGGR